MPNSAPLPRSQAGCGGARRWGGGRRGRGSLSQQSPRSHPGPGASPQDGPEDRPAGWRARLKPVEKSPAHRCVRRTPQGHLACGHPACGQGGPTAGASHRPATRWPLGTHGRAVCRRPVQVSCGSRSLCGQATCPRAAGLKGVRWLQGGSPSPRILTEPAWRPRGMRAPDVRPPRADPGAWPGPPLATGLAEGRGGREGHSRSAVQGGRLCEPRGTRPHTRSRGLVCLR